MSNYPRLKALERNMTYNHWVHCYNWNDFTSHVIEALAKEHNVTPADVRKMKVKIQKRHPKPNTEHDQKLASVSPNPNVCEYCGHPIVMMNGVPCNPRITRFITADAQGYTGREDHRETCPHKDRWKTGTQAGIEKSQGGQ